MCISGYLRTTFWSKFSVEAAQSFRVTTKTEMLETPAIKKKHPS